MSVDSTFDAAFTTILAKAQGTIVIGGSGGTSTGDGGGVIIPTATTSLVTVNITFSGGGSALPSSGLPGVVEIPGPLTLVWVHLFAGSEAGAPVAVTSEVELQLTTEGSFGSSSPIYGSTRPRLVADSVASPDLSGWTRNFTTGDAIVYFLHSFSGTATWLTLTMQMRPV